MDKNILDIAKGAKSPEELLKLAHENGMEEFGEENAKAYFDLLHKSGELSDEEMDVSAGGCCAVRSHGQKMVSLLNHCYHWRCNRCNNGGSNFKTPKAGYKDEYYCKDCDGTCFPQDEIDFSLAEGAGMPERSMDCSECYYCSYERGAWWCNNPGHYNE